MKRFLILYVVTLVLVSCGGRLPSPQRAHKVMTKSFHKYAKQYKTSDFGQHPIEKVEISDIREIQKNLAEVEGLIHLSGGPTYPVRVTFQKKPFGWRQVSWENLGTPKN